MAKKKLWSQLAPTTKARYKRHGITPNMYNNPKRRTENRDLFATAQGKAPLSYAAQRAKQLGLIAVEDTTRSRKDLAAIVDERLTPSTRLLAQATHRGMESLTPWDRMTDEQRELLAPQFIELMRMKDPSSGHIKDRARFDYMALQFSGTIDELDLGDLPEWELFRAMYSHF